MPCFFYWKVIMATVWIKPLHVNKGKNIAQTITDRTNYASNPEKTRKGELITGFGCSPFTTDAEFLLSKQQYFDQTGRDQGKNNILAYHIRQSFKPGEVTPEVANEIGRELALKFTKNEHAFIIATHIDKKHVHNHIIINSVNLDSTKKFWNFRKSINVIRRISDNICLEYGLSVVAEPKLARGHYGTWLGASKKPSYREKLRQAIDAVLLKTPKDYDEFLKMMEGSGYEVKRRGKRHSFRGDGKAFITLNSLKDGYTEDAIRDIIENKRYVTLKTETAPLHPIPTDNLLFQIQRCVKPKGSPGYDRWAAVFNLKQLARTFNFLQDNNLLEYELLVNKAKQAKDDFNNISGRIKEIDARLPDITNLQKHIGTYSKTKDIYAAYWKSGWSKKFYAENKANIDLHKATKKAFDDSGVAKLPTIKMLQTEYATLLAEKKTLYSKYKESRQFMQEILTVKQNAEQLLNYSDSAKHVEAIRV